MKNFISFVLLLAFAFGTQAQQKELPAINISVVSQYEFLNRGHHPQNNRKVIFQLVNNSKKPVIIYGSKSDEGFYPTGYMMVLDQNKNEWEYPNPSNSPTKWKDVSRTYKDKLILKPSESIKFEADMGDIGFHFRRTVYASYNEDDEPCDIRGEEFVLK